MIASRRKVISIIILEKYVICLIGMARFLDFIMKKTHELLAERTYSDLSPQIVFSNDRVIYSIDAEKQDAYVPLPPTWLDRLRAKLP